MDFTLTKDTATFWAACIAALAALFTAFVSPRLARGNERAKWIREQRHTNYARFIAAVQTHVLQDMRQRHEINILRTFQKYPDSPPPSVETLKRIELQTALAAYPAAMATINEVYLAANGARLVASKNIEPLIGPLVEMLLVGDRDGFASAEEESLYEVAITTFIREARREIAIDASLWESDPTEALFDMENENRSR